MTIERAGAGLGARLRTGAGLGARLRTGAGLGARLRTGQTGALGDPHVRRLALAVALGALTASVPVGGAGGQTGAGAPATPPTATNATAWLSYDGDHPLSHRWKLFLDASARRAEGPGGLREWQQLEALVGATVALTPRLSLSAGPALVRTYAYGERPLPGLEPERRVWEQLQWAWSAGPLTGSVRGRVEHRWIAHSERPTGAAPSAGSRTWRYTARAVPELRATLPLGSAGNTQAGTDPARWYATAALEGFGRLTGGQRYVEQTRETVALGRRMSATTRVELGYMHQALYDAPRRARERNHTALLVVRSAVPLSR